MATHEEKRRFKPAAGTFEHINLPLQHGKNVRKLSVSGNLPNRQATDSDQLVFLAPLRSVVLCDI
jgi:hypothetical protein